jgi:hypothetical protein
MDESRAGNLRGLQKGACVTPKTKQWLLFLLGLGALTEIRVVGSIAISELACYALAPFVFWAHRGLFKRLRFGTFFTLLALWAVSAVVADWLAHTYSLERWKGIAPIYSLFAVAVCAAVLLADDLRRIRWFIVGAFISALVATFVFTPAGVAETVERSSTGASIDSAFGYSAWLYGTVGAAFVLPVQLGYLRLPLWLSLSLVGGAAVAQLFLGGRSSFLVGCVSVVLLWLGRRARSAAYRPARMPVALLIAIMITVGSLAKWGYTVAVESGWLKDEERAKYEAQSKMGTSALALLMSGRGETFCGMFAALDKPFTGHGTKAWDSKGYYQDYVDKYGDEQDARTLRETAMRGIWHIPAHSHIISAWLWHGLGGLVFWTYVLWVLYKAVSEWIWYVPALVGWAAIFIPEMAWHVIFSPFGNRTRFAVMLTCVLLARSVMRQVRSGKRIELAAADAGQRMGSGQAYRR